MQMYHQANLFGSVPLDTIAHKQRRKATNSHAGNSMNIVSFGVICFEYICTYQTTPTQEAEIKKQRKSANKSHAILR